MSDDLSSTGSSLVHEYNLIQEVMNKEKETYISDPEKLSFITESFQNKFNELRKSSIEAYTSANTETFNSISEGKQESFTEEANKFKAFLEVSVYSVIGSKEDTAEYPELYALIQEAETYAEAAGSAAKFAAEYTAVFKRSTSGLAEAKDLPLQEVNNILSTMSAAMQAGLESKIADELSTYQENLNTFTANIKAMVEDLGSLEKNTLVTLEEIKSYLLSNHVSITVWDTSSTKADAHVTSISIDKYTEHLEKLAKGEYTPYKNVRYTTRGDYCDLFSLNKLVAMENKYVRITKGNKGIRFKVPSTS
ncbi:MAG: hypothetical protein GWP59_04590 [Chlamydiales bacterium]|nr:hypothetical protein [Chlamydiales bacterium]NCF70962.1 hypothetical protein [Chlamydiales bacterium]